MEKGKRRAKRVAAEANVRQRRHGKGLKTCSSVPANGLREPVESLDRLAALQPAGHLAALSNSGAAGFE